MGGCHEKVAVTHIYSTKKKEFYVYTHTHTYIYINNHAEQSLKSKII